MMIICCYMNKKLVWRHEKLRKQIRKSFYSCVRQITVNAAFRPSGLISRE